MLGSLCKEYLWSDRITTKTATSLSLQKINFKLIRIFTSSPTITFHMSDDASMSCVSCTSFFANDEVETTLYNQLYEKATTMKKPDCQLHEHIKHNDLLRQIVSSTIGTVVSVISLNPISVMKIRIQREDSLAVTSLRGAYRTILSTQGIRGFWAGASTGTYCVYHIPYQYLL